MELLRRVVDAGDITAAAASCGLTHRQLRGMLRRTALRDAIHGSAAQSWLALQMRAEGVVAEYARLAMSDLADFIVEDDGQISVRPGVDPQATRTLRSVEHTIEYDDQGRVTKRRVVLRTWDKLKALEILGRIRGVVDNEPAAQVDARRQTVIICDPAGRRVHLPGAPGDPVDNAGDGVDNGGDASEVGDGQSDNGNGQAGG